MMQSIAKIHKNLELADAGIRENAFIRSLSRFWNLISRDTYAWSFDALYMPGFFEILIPEDQQNPLTKDRHGDQHEDHLDHA